MAKQIIPYEENGAIFYADTCLPLVDAYKRKKIKFHALARHTYPGDRLTDDTIGLNSIGYWDAKDEQDWGLDWHRNEGIEIHFLESGQMPYAVDEHKMTLEANDLTITRPWQVHKVGDPIVGIGKFYWVIFDVGVRNPHMDWQWPSWVVLSKDDLSTLTKMLRQNEQARWKANPDIRKCFLKISQAVEGDINGSNASIIKLLVNELFIHILQMFKQGNIQLNEALSESLRSVQLFIEELNNKIVEIWTLESMAESAGLGITMFSQYFKQITNMSPMQYLNMKRIENAKHIITKNKSISITDLAYDCGFSSGQYFATMFKKLEKCTPQEYKKR